MLKNYRNIFLSLVSYVIAVVVFFTWTLFVPSASSVGIANSIGVGLGLILILTGLFFGFKSIKSKESSWAGHLMVIIGGLILASPIIVIMVGYGAF